MAELEHWIAALAGQDDRPADAFLWLDHRRTGGQGHLWLLVDGIGACGVGDVAAALVAITVAELYPEALDMYRDPLKALEIAIQDADRRLAAIKSVYSDLRSTRASFVAVALFNKAYHVGWAGTGCAYRVVGGVATRLTEDRVESVRDGLAFPATGVGSGALTLHLAGSFETEKAAIVLATNGLSRSVSEAVVGQSVQRLRAWDAATALLEIAEAKDGVTSKAVAVVRATPLEGRMETTVEAFKGWAASGANDWDSRSFVLQSGPSEAPGRVPMTNYPQHPLISGASDLGGAETVRESTMSFSPEDVRAIIAAGTVPTGELEGIALGPTDSIRASLLEPSLEERRESKAVGQTPELVEAPAQQEQTTPAGTMMFSPQDLAKVRADAESAVRDEFVDTQDPGRVDLADTQDPERVDLADTQSSEGTGLKETQDQAPIEEMRAFLPEFAGTQRFSPASTGSEHAAMSGAIEQSVNEVETWRGDSRGIKFSTRSCAQVVAVLIALAVLAGAVATYLAFWGG